MNYLWEVLLRAKEQGIPKESIRFLKAKNHSAYMEVSNGFLNQENLETGAQVEVNPYYRFYEPVCI